MARAEQAQLQAKARAYAEAAALEAAPEEPAPMAPHPEGQVAWAPGIQAYRPQVGLRAAGNAIRKNGHTVTVTNNGTITGTVG